MVCYFSLSCSTLHVYLEKLKRTFICEHEVEEIVETNSKGCIACGARECSRHDDHPTSEPWAGLKVHKQLDQAIEDFYKAILDNFISSWYNKLTPQQFFVDELRHQLRYASACLLRRAVKINYSRFITERLIPCALRHYTVCCEHNNGVSLLDNKMAVHPAAANRNAEIQYLRCITNAIMPYLLKNDDLENSVFRVFIREIFSGWVLLSLTDVLSDPYILNNIILIATSKDMKLAPLPTTPNYKVEFLETFARQIDTVYARRSKLLRLDLEYVLNDPQYLYSFMQFMKTTGHIHLLQFCKDIKSFQTRILNPELTSTEQITLFNEAWELWLTYFDPESSSSVPFEPSVVEEMRLLLADGAPNVKKLQTSRALYEAARQSHVVLEKIMLPKFLHSEEYYKLVIGPRIPPGFHKHMLKKPEKKVKTKTRQSRSQTPDGQFISYTDSNSELNIDLMDNMNLLKYIAQEEALREQDLSTCKVVLTHVQTIVQEEPRRGTIRMFTIAVHRVDPTRSDAALWTILRSENDFHLLRAKLTEFHGDGLLQNLPIPSRRDNSPLETIRYKYEDFLQRLLQMSLLQTSELLRIFLMEEGDFANAVLAASLAANNSDLSNLYQSVTHRLRKEKGQHLEGFMNVLLISCDKDKWEIGRRDVEIAQEIDEQFEPLNNQKPIRNIRDVHSTVFQNNFNIEPEICVNLSGNRVEGAIVGFTQCFIYLLINVVKVHAVIIYILGSIMGLMRDLVDMTFNSILNRILSKSLCERRLAHLIRVGHGLIFDRKSPHHRVDSVQHTELARISLLRCIPSAMKYITGNNIQQVVLRIFEVIQKPQFNKQVYFLRSETIN